MNVESKSLPLRLSIAHLMLWTVGSAFILTCFRVMDSLQEQRLVERLDWLRPAYQLSYSLSLGAQLGSVLLMVVRRVRGERDFPVQPGHWLLVVEGISAVAMLGGYGVFLAISRGVDDPGYAYFLLQLPNLAICSAGYAIAYSKTTRGSPWRYAFAAFVLVHGTQFTLFALSALTTYPSRLGGTWYGIWQLPPGVSGPALGGALLLASMADWRRHAERDLLHWVGIAAVIANLAFPVVVQMLVNAV